MTETLAHRAGTWDAQFVKIRQLKAQYSSHA